MMMNRLWIAAMLVCICRISFAGPEPVAELGTIAVSPLSLTVPLEFEPKLRHIPRRNPWYFPGWNVEQTKAYLTALGFPEPLFLNLCKNLKISETCGGTELLPDEKEVLEIPSEIRAVLYSFLAFYAINHEQAAARYFPAESLDEWLGETEISASTRKMLDQLVYRKGRLLCFADRDLLLGSIQDPEERFRVYKALLKVKTYEIRIGVGRDCDLNEFSQYWGSLMRNGEDVIPMLESLQESGGKIDITHLLPNLPRKLLYTFPRTDVERWRNQDCHWTTLNFFNPFPLQKSVGGLELKALFDRDYAEIRRDDIRYGDAIIYLTENNDVITPIHSATYICRDFVFTKNGTDLHSPWCFMRIEDLDRVYDFSRPTVRKYYRRNPASVERMQEQLGQRWNRFSEVRKKKGRPEAVIPAQPPVRKDSPLVPE